MTSMKLPGLKADGIHFGMPDKDYHEDPALGSTDIKNLLKSAPDYWFESHMNPAKVFDEDSTPARIRGKAMHAIVLEGLDAFNARFARRPDDPPGALTPAEKGAITKAAKRDLCGNGEELLHGDVYDRVLQARTMIEMHSDLKTAFSGGISEVSVFWTRPDGIRVKCRFDYLKPKGFGDLKSITNTKGKDFRQACHEALDYNGYLRQAVHYLDGRAQVPRFVADGKVYGDHDAALLKKIAIAKATGMAWVFWQAEGAPIVYGRSLSYDNSHIVPFERDRIEFAIKRYKECLATFGTDKLWVLDEPITEIDVSELPMRYGQNP